ncbi:MAG: hypothetical protein JJ913_14065 [Rhizobiaceae bacterium]|nr:hypothetical protein [Rhizobiaceae bacterium]
MIDIGIFSNGHGEDTIACKVLDRLQAARPGLSVEAWPMVGEGTAFQARRLPLVGVRNRLPSSGFATVSPRLMLGDLRAGWLRTHWRQYVAARRMRGRYRFVIAVGDIVPLVASVAARSPFVFIACAKSYYYNPGRAFTAVEKRLMRRHCTLTFPRDRMTVQELEKAGVPTLYAGNPMMDDLEGTGDRMNLGSDAVVIGMLAGTRPDAEQNLLDLLDAAGHLHRYAPDPQKYRFVFAARSELDVRELVSMIAADKRLAGWKVASAAEDAGATGVVVRLSGPEGIEALIAKNRFADVLRMASVVVGMAGTANEQAIGLGIPLIAVPSGGVQGDHYVKMKSVYFGDSALTVERNPDIIAAAIADLLADPDRRERMAEAGRERMGEPGASQAIADVILDMFDKGAMGIAAQ